MLTRCLSSFAGRTLSGACLNTAALAFLNFSFLIVCVAAQAEEHYDQRALARLASGTGHLKKGELDTAIKEFEEAVKIDGNCYQALNNIGLCYMRQGDLARAADRFRAALKVNPHYVGSLNNLGIVCYLQGHYDEAAIFYEQALSLSNNADAEIQTNYANCLRDKGDVSGAVDHYRQSIKLKPDYAPAYNNLGLTLHYLQKEQEAAVEVTKALKLKPDYAEAYYNLGIIRKALKQLPEAKIAFEQSLKYETNPTYAEATRKLIRDLSVPKSALEHLSRGYDRLEASDWRMAEEEFRQAIKLSPDNALAWNNLGLTLARQGKNGEALAAYKKAIALKHGAFAAAHYNLGQLLKDTGDKSGAEKAFRQAIAESNGTHAYAHVALGVILKEKGDLASAVKNYKLAILQSGDTLPVVHYNLALALEHMESTRDAVREYQIYLSQAPHGLNAEAARQRLKRLGVEM
jgi:tetratricopeptide (TPR) repeat protein